MCIVLTKPSPEMKEEAEAFKSRFVRNDEPIYGSCGLARFETYEEWLAYIEEVSRGLRKDRVPSSTYFAVESHSGKIVGIIDIRHTLNEEHYNDGHIGYSVRPDRRKMGYGTEILRQGLEIAKALRIGIAVVTCGKDNEGSRRVIENNGGKFVKEYLQDGVPYRMYEIDLR